MKKEVDSNDLQLRVRRIDNGFLILTRGSQRFCEDVSDVHDRITELIDDWAEESDEDEEEDGLFDERYR